jgi:hypothetical protein
LNLKQNGFTFSWAGRARAMPHIKTYMRVSRNGDIPWLLMTSSNLSESIKFCICRFLNSLLQVSLRGVLGQKGKESFGA